MYTRLLHITEIVQPKIRHKDEKNVAKNEIEIFFVFILHFTTTSHLGVFQRVHNNYFYTSECFNLSIFNERKESCVKMLVNIALLVHYLLE